MTKSHTTINSSQLFKKYSKVTAIKIKIAMSLLILLHVFDHFSFMV